MTRGRVSDAPRGASGGTSQPKLRVAIYQYAGRDETPADRIARLAAELDRGGAGSTDLVLTPELFLSGYNIGTALVRKRAEPADGPSSQAIAELARKYRTAIAYGYPQRDGDAFYNAVQCIGADGQRLANHRKLQLPSDYERASFARGNCLTPFNLNGWKASLLVCYDVEFPESVRGCALGGADLVIVPTALKDRWGFVAQKMVPTRAFENGVFLMYANYAGGEGDWTYLGESCVIGPDGSEVARAGSGEEMLRGTLDPALIAPARATLPYLRDRDAIPGR
jgi:predicted amidohydrolase